VFIMETASNTITDKRISAQQRQSEYAELIALLRQAQPFVYFPSSGNGGDALIAHATFAFFRRHQLAYRIYSEHDQQRDSTLVIGGGGGFVDGYRKMSLLVQHVVTQQRSVIVLPSSCLGYEKELAMMDERFHFFARESVTAEHVLRHTRGAKVSFCHDMAISFDESELPAMSDLPWLLRGQPFDYQLKWLLKRSRVQALWDADLAEASMLRSDRESLLSPEERPRENYDISHLIKGKMDREDRAAAIAEVFCGVIARQKRIVTDRLHVSIACGLLGIPCEMRANNYHKNRAIYEESIKKFFPCVAFSGGTF